MSDELIWRQEQDLRIWDHALAKLGGHPLQSALWGEARRLTEGIEYRCFVAQRRENIAGLARVEARRVPLLGRVAWIPRGPVCFEAACVASLEEYLRGQRYILSATSPWRSVPETGKDHPAPVGPRTIWVDLALGKEALWSRLDSQWRYGVGRARREGVTVAQTREKPDIESFHRLCEGIGQAKGFKLSASLPQMHVLLDLSSHDSPVEARLFAAKFQGRLIAGAFVLRSCRSVHYIWGGVDREYSKLRAGEAVQWAVMEWAVEQGCELYDLEGIDPVNNHGTYEFKKKMGGREVTLAGTEFVPLTWIGKLALAGGRRLGRLS